MLNNSKDDKQENRGVGSFFGLEIEKTSMIVHRFPDQEALYHLLTQDFPSIVTKSGTIDGF